MLDAHRVIVVIEEPRRNPYEVWLLAALLLSGLLFLFGLSPPPESVEKTLPKISIWVWNVTLVTGTVVALIGLFWKQAAAGKTIQIAGNLWTGTGAFTYTCVLFYYNGWAATLAGLVVGSITIAAVTKSLQLRRQVKHIIREVRKQHGSGTFSDTDGGVGSTAS